MPKEMVLGQWGSVRQQRRHGEARGTGGGKEGLRLSAGEETYAIVSHASCVPSGENAGSVS